MPSRSQIRRRRITALLVLVAAAATVAFLVFGLPGGGDDRRSVDTPPPPPELVAATGYCDTAAADDPDRLAGSMLIVRWNGARSKLIDRAVRRGLIAGVIVFPEVDNATLTSETARLQRLAEEAGTPPLVVSTDQEGGSVKRFPDAPPSVSPREMADAGAPAREFRTQGRATGRYLADLGINVDYAPVLDVPADPDALTWSRSFGDDTRQVSRRGLAFARGLGDSEVIATAKHFPGLGQTGINTDLEAATITADRTELEAGLAAFRDAVAAGIPSIMTANAIYTALDPQLPASLSPAVVTGLLRGELGFEGAIVSDDLGAGAITSAYRPAEAAVLAAAAGNDWLLYANTNTPPLKALKRALRQGQLELDAIRASCVRTVALRETVAATPAGNNG